MVKVNENYLKLPGSYLFSEIARRINQFKKKIRLLRLLEWESVM